MMFIVKNIFVGALAPAKYILDGYSAIGMPKEDVLAYLGIILLLCVFDYVSLKQDVYAKIGKLKTPIRWLIYFVMVWLIIIFTPVTSGSEFIYFQF